MIFFSCYKRVKGKIMLKPCWEITKCGREEGGDKVHEFGFCKAYPNHGHSCWIVTGTCCDNEVQGNFVGKFRKCFNCEVYKLYSTTSGSKKEEFQKEFPEEFKVCQDFFLNQSQE